MTIRVLARIPDVGSPPAEQSAEVTSGRKVEPSAAAGPSLRQREARRHTGARRQRPAAPLWCSNGSIAALALIAAAVWSAVAYREATRPDPVEPGTRIAAVPSDAAVVAPETTLR
jgi:hypothetical protein